MLSLPPHLLFLSAEVQPFLHAGIMALLAEKNLSITIVAQKHPLPFEDDSVKTLLLAELSDEEILALAKPCVVVCAGWMERRYLTLCKAFKKQGIPTLCQMDTPWRGTLKQHLHTVIAPFSTKKFFSHCWVPGAKQKAYAKRLGFSEQNILNNLLAANTQLFASPNAIPYHKRFLFAGRLIERKVLTMLQAFHTLSTAERQGWQLMIIGDGPMRSDKLLHHEAITIKDAVNTQQLANEMRAGGVFVLTAINEPWAVSIQEAAAAGMPLIVSKQCGAAAVFLQNGKNGFVVDGHSVTTIREAMLRFINMPQESWHEFSDHSQKIALRPCSQDWAKVLLPFCT